MILKALSVKSVVPGDTLTGIADESQVVFQLKKGVGWRLRDLPRARSSGLARRGCRALLCAPGAITLSLMRVPGSVGSSPEEASAGQGRNVPVSFPSEMPTRWLSSRNRLPTSTAYQNRRCTLLPDQPCSSLKGSRKRLCACETSAATMLGSSYRKVKSVR